MPESKHIEYKQKVTPELEKEVVESSTPQVQELLKVFDGIHSRASFSA